MLLRRLTGWPGINWESPLSELERMRRQMDMLSERLISVPLRRESYAGVFPLMNVTETDDHYFIRAELPGIEANDLDISVTGDKLSISGERKIPVEKETANYHRREREAGKFSRIVGLPAQVDTEKADARCVNGILTVTLPKAEAAKPKQITIHAS